LLKDNLKDTDMMFKDALDQLTAEQKIRMKSERDIRLFEESKINKLQRKNTQSLARQMYDYAEKSKVNPALKKSLKGISPNMPLGKIGRGIESYSKLDDPRISPISNFYCRGYMDIKEEVAEHRFKKNKTDIKKA
tara:strand:+ start:201 stop:605 length:405 start_codon:yes stop_codon:yes gene_type:complete